MSSMLLDAQQVTLSYAERTVLDAVDLRVGVDSRAGLVGENGAGKSTLLRVLAGFSRRTQASCGAGGRSVPSPSSPR